MGMGDLTDLFVDPDEDQPQLADHSVLNAQDTFEIPDRNGSHNVKGEASDQWTANRSYGGFPAVENGGGLHEFMPDPEKSQFVAEEDLPKVASQLSVRAKRAMMKGASTEAVLEDLRRRIPKEAKYRKYFARLASEIADEVGLLGTVYIDPSIFTSCTEGVKFLQSSSLKPTYVLELDDCKKCAYKADRNCVLFQRRIEAHVPWEDKVAVRHMIEKAAAEVGATEYDLELLSGLENPEDMVKALYLGSFKDSAERVYEGSETEAPRSESRRRSAHSLFSAAVMALEADVSVLKIVDRLNDKTGSVHETRRIMKQALSHAGLVKQTQLPCPDCEVKATSNRGKLLASVLPSRLSVTACGECGGCGRDHGEGLNMWGKPMVAPGMAPGFAAPQSAEEDGPIKVVPAADEDRNEFEVLLSRDGEEQIPVDMVSSSDPSDEVEVDMTDLSTDIEMTMDEGQL